MFQAIDIAEYFLKKFGPLEGRKLQKLLYYSQVRSLVDEGHVLFPNEIQAWMDGPVVRDVYHQQKYLNTRDQVYSVNGNADRVQPIEHLLERVWEIYGGFTGNQLSQMTHNEAPWCDVRKGLADHERSQRPIPLGSLLTFYLGRPTPVVGGPLKHGDITPAQQLKELRKHMHTFQAKWRPPTEADYKQAMVDRVVASQQLEGFEVDAEEVLTILHGG